MRKYLDTVYKKQSLIYKYFLYFLTVGCIVFFFPRGGKFKYEFQKGKPWQYENLYAPFDFTIKKSTEEIGLEKQEIEGRHIDYYSYDPTIVDEVRQHFVQQFAIVFPQERYSASQRKRFEEASLLLLDNFYRYGLLENSQERSEKAQFYLVKDNEAILLESSELPGIVDAGEMLGDFLAEQSLTRYQNQFRELFFDILRPNVKYDDVLTKKALDDEFTKISMTRGSVDEGKLIVAKGEVVEAENLKILNSLKAEYESELWTENNFLFIISGYTILVALVLMMLMLFLKKYRPEVWRNNVKVTFIFFNILLMVFVTTLVVKYNEAYVFVVPLCILPLILKTFFDARLGLFVHVLTVMILGFVVPNSFEYIFLQIIAGIVTILTVSELYKRANLFISVGQITLIYMVGYFAFYVIQEGSIDQINLYTFGFFLLNGMITLFAQPLIYVYEKIFGLISDVSLLELSDTNSRLLKELANKAPGTFHHSLQVANLAEAAANEIGANAMLVRVGALYHDIGKMNKPAYFTENQVTNINPHDDLQPRESARIIIDHVIEGIEIARQNRIPDRVIDFIRTHHGTTFVYYFYKKQQDSGGDVKESDYRYPGPIPFSKETAILMMSDAVEAASKSLNNPTYTIIDEFVEKIVSGQMNALQFLNANITFKEIQSVKKVLKQKLTNIYHLRVEYPE
jgi:putative nucleotidyltransferase with HDIG domain